MGTIILSILAVIGKILLYLLLFLLILLCLILFVPIRYHISGIKDEAILEAQAQGSWLCKLIRFQFSYPQPGKPQLFVLFFDLLSRKPKKSKVKKNKGKKQAEEENSAEQIEYDSIEDIESVTHADTEDYIPTEEVSSESKETIEKQKQNLFVKLQSIPEKLSAIKGKFIQTEDKVTALQDTITYYYDLLQKPATAKLWKQVKPSLLKAGKQLLPRRIHVHAIIGTGDPDSTAKIYGISSVVFLNFQKDIEIIPEMEEKKLEGEFDIKGHLYLCVLLFEGIKLLLNKRLRLFIKKCKAGRKK